MQGPNLGRITTGMDEDCLKSGATPSSEPLGRKKKKGSSNNGMTASRSACAAVMVAIVPVVWSAGGERQKLRDAGLPNRKNERTKGRRIVVGSSRSRERRRDGGTAIGGFGVARPESCHVLFSSKTSVVLFSVDSQGSLGSWKRRKRIEKVAA
ncbi:hypothetical protein CPLU01_05074 [Colletotrichum plurivorum]|uniref:Uncharacterized protein n=1 Tax=Colletotrichum plurivorum TaxID=2175906 RepID=A0A8H6KNQ6_9PEZI|nr:hypothetical protein CPLU01_05074 [Colletotrichum plurivorum]